MSVKESDQQDDYALELLHELLDNISYRIILSTIESARSVGEISSQNKIPLSSTYKKIKRLTKHGLIYVARIEIDDSGKKIVFYKSKVKKMQFGIEGENLSIQFENNALLKTVRLVAWKFDIVTRCCHERIDDQNGQIKSIYAIISSSFLISHCRNKIDPSVLEFPIEYIPICAQIVLY